MRLAILDPRNGDRTAELFVVGEDGSLESRFALGYVPEVTFNPPTQELIVLDSDVHTSPTRHYLKIFDADTLTERLVREIPIRPMYAGFPGRSIGGRMSRSGRYIYFVESGEIVRLPDDLTFRLRVARYDRVLDRVELGKFSVASCHVGFGIVGDSEEELFFHLSCDYPSTIAVGSFGSVDWSMIRLVELASRQHGPQETNGSWLDRKSARLYCVDRQGTVYCTDLAERRARQLAALHLDDGAGIPMHQIYGADGVIYIGVAESDEEQGPGLVSEIRYLAADSGGSMGRHRLPHRVASFVVSPDGELLAGANPYSGTVYLMDLSSGQEYWRIDQLGQTPAEIIPIDWDR